MAASQTLALFDLDGTLTRRDTLSDLLVRRFGVWRCLLAGIRLAPWLIAVPLRCVHRDTAKVKVLGYFFAGMKETDFVELGRWYATSHLAKLLRPLAWERLQWHRDKGHRVIVVSASIVDWIRPWTESLNIEVLATELERHNGQLTGELDGPNCRKAEKVTRLRQHLDLDAYSPIYAYGDTEGDRAMLAVADYPVYRGLR